MGFKIVEEKTVAGLPGYILVISNPVRAAEFGFKAWPRRAASKYEEIVDRNILCWWEKEGDHLIIWIDSRTVEITDKSKVPEQR